MRFQCLVLDHDDTVVDSTAAIHYPPFADSLRVLRPNVHLTLDDYFLFNFDPGFSEYCENVLHFTKEEADAQQKQWCDYVAAHVPKAYDGMRDLLTRFRKEGGHICVVSHSLRENILRDYRENGLPLPEIVFGWEMPPDKRKPAPWPLREIMRELSLEPDRLLMVDDLKPGKVMADVCAVPFAAAGWAHQVDKIVRYMKAECEFYLPTVRDLSELVFGDERPASIDHGRTV